MDFCKDITLAGGPADGMRKTRINPSIGQWIDVYEKPEGLGPYWRQPEPTLPDKPWPIKVHRYVIAGKYAYYAGLVLNEVSEPKEDKQ